jgi:hypothetical protein
MTVAELKQLVPLADVCELSPERRYLVKLPKGTDMAAMTSAAEVLRGNPAMQGRWIICRGDVEFFEIKP